MPLKQCQSGFPISKHGGTNLESIFSGEAFVTESARKRFNRQVNSFVSFQIVIAIEALRALIALERPLVVGGGGRTPVHLHLSAVPAVKSGHHAARQTWRGHAEHGQLVTGAMEVGQDRTGEGTIHRR